MTRNAQLTRQTKETNITLSLDLDGTGSCEIATGVGFFDHMLEAFGKHGMFDLKVHVEGDTWVDDHHSVEDTGIVLGKAFAEALGNKAGITRFADVCIPMDETLIMAAIDISGRGELFWDVDVPTEKVGSFDTELAQEFFAGFARDAGITLHLRKLAGRNSHHILEACFKAAGRALRFACEMDPRQTGIPSTKGSLA